MSRFYVRRVASKVYFVDPNVPLWEVIDRETGKRVPSDVFEGKNVADRQVDIYNEQWEREQRLPTDYIPRIDNH